MARRICVTKRGAYSKVQDAEEMEEKGDGKKGREKPRKEKRNKESGKNEQITSSEKK
jgi:hypothetical protein